MTDIDTDGQDQEEEDVLVSANGVMKPISSITEDDQQDMTDDEYDEYYRQLASTGAIDI